jgi:hypothetical protein
MSILSIINELTSNSSTNKKLEILNENKENKILKEFFRLSLDSSISFYIKKIPYYKNDNGNNILLLDAMKELSNLSERIYTGHAGIAFLSGLLAKCSDDDAEVIKLIIKKDPGCGVSYTTVNKVWSKLIEVWPCMLCERSTEKNLSNIKYPAVIQEKSDGGRLNIVYEDGKISIRSRNGSYANFYDCFDNDVKIFHEHLNCNFVIDGEVLFLDDNGNVMERKKGNGYFNKAIQNTITFDEAYNAIVNIWDIIPLDDFKKGKGTKIYIDTLNFIYNVFKEEGTNVLKFHMIRSRVVDNKQQALLFYKEMIEKGKEGAVLKNFNSVWENKRSKNHVKLKIENEVELKVVDIEPHKKKDEWIGSLICESSDGYIRVNVGSGLKDDDRKKDKNNYIGKVISVKSNGIIDSNGKDTLSLFLPIYKGVRLDKDEADTLKDIQESFERILGNG